MIKNLKRLFSSNKDVPTPQEKAKAVYFVLVSQAMVIIQDILDSAPDEFKDSKDYKAFLGNEVGVIMCLHSTREGYERYFKDNKEGKLFTATLFSLFKHHLRISWDVFDHYLSHGEKNEEPDKIFMRLFTGRIVAFLNQDDEFFTGKDKGLLYSYHPDALIYAEYYVRIFESVLRILNKYARESANIKEVLQMADELDKILKQEKSNQQNDNTNETQRSSELKEDNKSDLHIRSDDCGNNHMIIQCESCSQKLRIPIKKEPLKITCPSCKNIFSFHNADKT